MRGKDEEEGGGRISQHVVGRRSMWEYDSPDNAALERLLVFAPRHVCTPTAQPRRMCRCKVPAMIFSLNVFMMGSMAASLAVSGVQLIMLKVILQ